MKDLKVEENQDHVLLLNLPLKNNNQILAENQSSWRKGTKNQQKNSQTSHLNGLSLKTSQTQMAIALETLNTILLLYTFHLMLSKTSQKQWNNTGVSRPKISTK